MTLRIARFVNLMLASVLVGNELGGWAGVHPALYALPTGAHIRAEQAVTRRYGRLMPVVMTATIVSCVPVLSLTPDRRSAAYRYTLGGMLAFLAMLGVTFTGNMPLNRRVLALSADNSPADWLALRARWDRWHTLRNILNVAGLGCLVLGALAAPAPRSAA